MSMPRTPLPRSPIDNLEQVSFDIYRSLFDVSDTDGEELLKLLTICEVLDKAIDEYESHSRLASVPIIGSLFGAIEKVVHAYSRRRVQEAENAKGEFNTFLSMFAQELGLSIDALKGLKSVLAEDKKNLVKIRDGKSLENIRLKVVNRFRELFSRGAFKATSLNTQIINAFLDQVTNADGSSKYSRLENDQISILLLPLLLFHTPGTERNSAIRESLTKQLHALLTQDLVDLNESLIEDVAEQQKVPVDEPVVMQEKKAVIVEDAPSQKGKMKTDVERKDPDAKYENTSYDPAGITTLSGNRIAIAQNLEALWLKNLLSKTKLSSLDKETLAKYASHMGYTVAEREQFSKLSEKKSLDDEDKKLLNELSLVVREKNAETGVGIEAKDRTVLREMHQRYSITAKQKALVSRKQVELEAKAENEGVLVSPAKEKIIVRDNYNPNLGETERVNLAAEQKANFEEKRKILQPALENVVAGKLSKIQSQAPSQQPVAKLSEERQAIREKLSLFFASKNPPEQDEKAEAMPILK